MHNQIVTTLIALEKTTILNDALVTSLESALREAGAGKLSRRWLASQKACDILCEDLPADTITALVDSTLEERSQTTGITLPVDHITQPATNRKKQLLISDMDSTIITVECVDELADFAGLKAEVSTITDRAMNGELDFKSSLKERVALLKNLPVSVLEKTYSERIRFMAGAQSLIATMRAHGATCLLVSGGFTYFTEKIADTLGFHATFANRLEIANQQLTGKVIEPILDKDSKLHTLKEYIVELGIRRDDALAVGDGANDLPMLLHAGLGVAYHAKKMVQQTANYRINHTDLTSLLYAQGYTEQDIISSL